MMCSMEVYEVNYDVQVDDDMSGFFLMIHVLKRQGRKMKEVKHNVYMKVPIQQFRKET